jgi:hypothetical protein
MSVTPGADFGDPKTGELILEWHTTPDGYAKVLRADRAVYISGELYNLILAGWSPFAQIIRQEPWDWGILKIRGLDGLVVYKITGYCGPRVPCYLAEMPD